MNHPTHDLTEKKWHFNRNGVLEPVPVERWAWGAVLDDGSEMHQYDAQGVFHQIGEIPQERVKLWVLYKTGPEDKRIDLVVPAGASLIHKYKRYVLNSAQLSGGDKSAETTVTVYVFGYKIPGRKVTEVNGKFIDGVEVGAQYHYNFVMPNDNIVQSIEEVPVFDFGLAQIAAEAENKK